METGFFPCSGLTPHSRWFLPVPLPLFFAVGFSFPVFLTVLFLFRFCYFCVWKPDCSKPTCTTAFLVIPKKPGKKRDCE
jgi:hypothetical protein